MSKEESIESLWKTLAQACRDLRHYTVMKDKPMRDELFEVIDQTITALKLAEQS